MGTAPLIVAVLDSGVGCLTFLPALSARLPMAQFVFAMDNAHFPYGPKTEEEVIGCVHSFAGRVVSTFSPDILVIACNTASTVVLPTLRSRFDIPVVGVVPAIKPAASITRTHTVGLLATPGTIQRPYTSGLIRQFAGDCQVIGLGSVRLVSLAEDKLRGLPISIDEVRSEIAPLFSVDRGNSNKVDTIVLGCTHFPVLQEELVQAAPWPVAWIDSSEAVAERVYHLVKHLIAKQTIGSECEHTAAFSSADTNDSLITSLRTRGIHRMAILDGSEQASQSRT